MMKQPRLLPDREWKRDAHFLPVMAFFLVFLLESCARGGAGAFFRWLVMSPLMALRTWLFLMGLTAPVWMIPFRRGRGLTLWGMAVLAAVLGYVNRYKVMYRFEPVLLSDLSLLGDAMTAVKELDFAYDWGNILLTGVILAAILILILVFLKGKNCSGLLIPLLGLAAVLAVPAFSTYSRAEGGKQTDLVSQTEADGVILSMAEEAHYRADMRGIIPDEETVKALYAVIAEQAPEASAGEEPNIILVLAESFCDQEWLGRYVSLDRELMPFYDSLIEGCRSGRVYVPKVGGGTSESEFEVLSGISSRYSFNPYSIGLPPVNSVAAVLGEKGYETSMVHLFRGVYYNRYYNLHMEGFGNLYTTDTQWGPFERGSAYVSDEEHYAMALEKMAETPEKDFLFIITMQNHGPYDYTDPDLLSGYELPFSGEYSTTAGLVLGNYCHLLEKTDAALKGLIRGAEESGEPTWIIFFGDHIPPFGTDVYQELGIPLSGADSHRTPYFIWTNTEENLPKKTDLYATELMPYALAEAGLGDDPFFAFVNRLRQEAGDAPLKEEKRASGEYDVLCTDVLFGGQYMYREAGLTPSETETNAGGKMEVMGFSCREEEGKIYLKPEFSSGRPLRYTLYVNGEKAEGSCVPSDLEGPIRLECRIESENGAMLNTSGEVEYAGIRELKADCGMLREEVLPLGEDSFTLIHRDLLGWDVYLTEKSYDSAALPVMRAKDKTFKQKPVYEKMDGAWQYVMREDGRIYLSVPSVAAPGCSTEEVRSWMEENGGELSLSRE